MMRLSCLILCLTLAFLSKGALSVVLPNGNIAFDMYLSNLTLDAVDDIVNKTSGIYKMASTKIIQALSPIGGENEDVTFSDGGGCLKAYIVWRNSTQVDVNQRINSLRGQSINIWNTVWSSVSFDGCPGNITVLKFRFYVVNMTWSENFKNKNSSDYQGLKRSVENHFATLGGSIRTLEVTQIFSCMDVYIEWNALNRDILFNLISSLRTNGLTYEYQTYMIQNNQCTAPSGNITLVSFRFYVVNMTWSENFKNKNSSDYQGLKRSVENHFATLGGGIRTLAVAQNFGCMDVYVEWHALNPNDLFYLISSLRTNGLTYEYQTYMIQIDQCTAPSENITVVNVRFYVVNMTWSENFKNKNSSDYQGLKQTIEDYFATLGGGIRTLEVAQNFGCMDVYIEWNALNPDNLFNLISTLRTNGLTYEYQTYMIQNNQCTAPSENITVVNVRFYVVNMTWSENFKNKNSSDYQGLKQTIEDYFATLGGGIRTLEVAQNFGCMDVYIEWNALNPDNLFNLISTLRTNGLTYEYQTYMIQNNQCTAPSDQVTVLSLKFFVVNMMWSDSFADHNSQDYQQIRQAVQDNLSSFGGSIQTLQINKNYGCLQLFLEWNASYSVSVTDLMSALKKNGISIENQIYTVQSTPCILPPDEVNECSPFSGHVIGICLEECGDATDRQNCSQNHKCCSNGCGHTCQRVGFALKIYAIVVVNKTWEKEMTDASSAAFIEMQIVAKMIHEKLLNSYPSSSIQDIELTSLSIYMANGQICTQMDVELYLAQDMSNEDLKLEGDSMKDATIEFYEESIKIIDIQLGRNSASEITMCNGMNCSGICKELRSGIQFCSCNKGYTGADCATFEVIDMCALGLCLNAGTCHNLPGGQHFCECPEGFSGTSCENAANHCPIGQPVMTTSGELTCRRQPCPLGFMCNADPLDRWTACCFQKDFMCEVNPCQAGGVCAANFFSGDVCRCPTGRDGLFCERASNGTTVRTSCQNKQLFSDWVISTLKTGNSQLNITLADMRMILGHLGYQYYPTDLCDAQGNFKVLAQGVLVVNTGAPRVEVCMNKSGDYDPDCAAAVCEGLSYSGVEFCLNGGKCLGSSQRLCDCSSTGYHGVRCEQAGEGVNETPCTLQRDIAYLAMGALNGSVDLMPGFGKEVTVAAARRILDLWKMDNIFVPYCDAEGQYEYRGCLYLVTDTSKKSCYCASQSGSKFGDEESTYGPPDNCLKDPDMCPEDEGECEQPVWWCSKKLQCNPDMERCVYYTQCTDSACKQEPEFQCLVRGKTIACDPHPCKDNPYKMCQPCGSHGTCVNLGTVNNTADMGYRCMCNMGFSGAECEINEKICSLIPNNLCGSHCIGDIGKGQLCQCDTGYGGIFCDKQARSQCEMRKALYDDVLDILYGRATNLYGFDVSQIQDMARYIAQQEGVDQIAVLNCTESGSYAKVQCMVSINDLSEKKCYCSDSDGTYISSNWKPYVGFDICTAPTDPQEFAQTICSLPTESGLAESAMCLNGGTCMFDMYAGRFCLCPDGYHGLFCQKQGNAVDAVSSLCGLFTDAGDTALEITRGEDDWITSDTQREMYLNLTLKFLMSQKNESQILKIECQKDGTFGKVACFFDIKTGNKESCYCWNSKELQIVGPPIESTDSDKCASASYNECPLVKCLYICEHGYKVNNNGCQTCDCKNPCEDMKCEVGQRCVIEKSTGCDNEDALTCTKVSCMSEDKPGACPGYSPASFNSTLVKAITSAGKDISCNVTCYDDTDCGGNKKCCEQCGNMCTEPQATSSCQDYQMKMQAQLEVLRMAQDLLKTSMNLSLAGVQLLKRVSDAESIWIPDCESNIDQFKPLQCQRFINGSGGLGDIASCFCVDRQGNKVEGANAVASDPASCDTKPFTCPFIGPMETQRDTERCTKDFDCIGNRKCCNSPEGQVCVTPVDTSKMTTTLDKIMLSVCQSNSVLCQGGSQCVGNWKLDGTACKCSNDTVGPFCEWNTSDVAVVPKSPCQRKSFTQKVFIEYLQSKNSSVSFKKLLSQNTEYAMEDIFSVAWYNCTPDGAFEPKQCIFDVISDGYGQAPSDCFCVDEDGLEVIGTRVAAEDSHLLSCGVHKRGQCPTVKPGAVATCANECSADGDCQGKLICCSNGCGTTCVVPDVDETSDCLSRQMEAMRSQNMQREASQDICDTMHIPMCKKDGTWATEQCQSATGICWCVSSRGYYVNNTITRGLAKCQEVSESMMMKADESKLDVSQVNYPVCDGGTDFHCCSQSLCSQKCAAYPEAVCRINPCGGCRAEFYSADGKIVNCTEGFSQCQQEQEQAKATAQGQKMSMTSGSGVNVKSLDSSVVNTSAESAQETTISPNYPARCQYQPETGRCRGFQLQWYFDPANGQCSTFVYGLCDGNDNRFDSPEECYTTCAPSLNPCANISCENNTPCELQYDEFCNSFQNTCNITAVCKAQPYKVEGPFTPDCMTTGEYSYKQCYGSYCWCVNSLGQYINGLTVEQSSSLVCTANGAAQSVSNINGTCPNGREPNIDCTKACTGKVCPGQPTAKCVVDLCSSKCKTKFVDDQGMELNCTVCDGGTDFRCCSQSLCSQKCAAYPEAVCRINPFGGCKAEFYSADGKVVNCTEGLSQCQQEQEQAKATAQGQKMNMTSGSGVNVKSLDSSVVNTSAESAQETTVSPDYPARCQYQPETGPCKGFQLQWYFDPAYGQCSTFVYGLCDGNDNRFDSPEECYTTCAPSLNPCANISCENNTPCELQYDEFCYSFQNTCNITAVCKAQPYKVEGPFTPDCMTTGEYSYKQCYGSYCWCVNSLGQYINGLTVEQSSSLVCTANGAAQSVSNINGICPNGREPNIGCTKACTDKVCPGQPTAKCVVDLCSSECKTKFVDDQGMELNCTACPNGREPNIGCTKACTDKVCPGQPTAKCVVDLCSSECKTKFVDDQAMELNCTVKVPCPGTRVTACSATICEKALQQKCSRNPCAVCMVDPCTCQPYFVDAKTHQTLNGNQCSYLSTGLCELKACNMLSNNEKANFSKVYMTSSDTSLPECDDSGIFKPRQCQATGCKCVDQYGQATGGNNDGSCKAIDKVWRLLVTFTYRADYSTFKINNKLKTLVDTLMAILKELGIDPRIIKSVSEPYDGPIKIDVIFEDTPDSYNRDMALIKNALEQFANMGALDLMIDGQSVPLSSITQEVKTESQKSQGGGDGGTKTTKSSGGLNETEKIIIGVVCGCVGLLIIGIIAYCLCCRRRTQKKALDDTSEHSRGSTSSTFHKSEPMFNKAYDEESETMKIRL